MEVNLLAILVAGVVSFAIGGAWYSGLMFGPLWVRLLGWSDAQAQEAKKGAGAAMATGFVMQLVTAYIFASFLGSFEIADASGAIQTAFWLWLGFVATTQLGSVLWEKKPFKLFVLNAAYSFVSLAVMGIILALWK